MKTRRERSSYDEGIEGEVTEGLESSGYHQETGSVETGDSPTSGRRYNLRDHSTNARSKFGMNFPRKGEMLQQCCYYM